MLHLEKYLRLVMKSHFGDITANVQGVFHSAIL